MTKRSNERSNSPFGRAQHIEDNKKPVGFR